jgi:hypothetical protein
MVKWHVVCRPKEFGRLGIINTQILNECLMTKWIWKLYNQKDYLWARLVRGKYMQSEDLFRSRSDNGSQWWKSLHKIKHLFKKGVVHKIGNGKATQLWNDVLLTQCGGRNWQINFRRMLDPGLYEEWIKLKNMLNEVELIDAEDQICWVLPPPKTSQRNLCIIY